MIRTSSLLLAVLCVVLIAVGQILFKMAALRSQADGDITYLSRWFSWPMLSAIVVYGLATMLWVWVLRSVQLNVAYPLVALAFVLVPLLAYLFLNETLSNQQMIGSAIIVAGIAISYA